jgi:hypothetical protein
MRQSDSVRTLQQQQWRVLACGLQTGVWLIAAVVLSRRISGDASGLTTQWAACLVGSVAIAVSVLTTSFLKGDNPRASSADDELLPEALSLLPGVMLGLALLPAGSGGGLTALLGLFVCVCVCLCVFVAERGNTPGHLIARSRLLQRASGAKHEQPERTTRRAVMQTNRESATTQNPKKPCLPAPRDALSRTREVTASSSPGHWLERIGEPGSRTL